MNAGYIILASLPGIYFNAALMTNLVHALNKHGVIFSPVKSFKAHWPWFKYFAALLPVGVLASLMIALAPDNLWVLVAALAFIGVAVLVVSVLMHRYLLQSVKSRRSWNIAIAVIVLVQVCLVALFSFNA